MYSQIKKDQTQELLQTSGQQKPTTAEDQKSRTKSKRKLIFASNKNHRFYYQTPSRKQSHR